MWPKRDNNDHIEVIWVTLRPHRLPRDTTHITIGVEYHNLGAEDHQVTGHLSMCSDHILKQHPPQFYNTLWRFQPAEGWSHQDSP